MEQFLCPLADVEALAGRRPLVIRLPDGLEVGVIWRDGNLLAYENRCPHMGGPVCLGDIVGQTEVELDEKGRALGTTVSDTDLRLVCPWHGLEFDLATGQCPTDDSFRLRSLDVFLRDGQVYLDRSSLQEEQHG